MSSNRILPAAVASLAIAVLSCTAPTAPSRGTASITITGLSVEEGGTATQGFGLDATLTLTASAELLDTRRVVNPYVGAGRLPFYLCLSADGVHFTSQCQAGIGIGSDVQARVVGPSASFNIPMTTHLIAFVIPAEEYGTPVTAFVRFGGGNTVPQSALAVHVLPWTIHWEPAPGAQARGPLTVFSACVLTPPLTTGWSWGLGAAGFCARPTVTQLPPVTRVLAPDPSRTG